MRSHFVFGQFADRPRACHQWREVRWSSGEYPLSITSVRLMFDIAKVKQPGINWQSNG